MRSSFRKSSRRPGPGGVALLAASTPTSQDIRVNLTGNNIKRFSAQAACGGYNYNYNYANTGATGTQFNLGVRYTFK